MNYTTSINITNSSDEIVAFFLEPWGERMEMMPGATFVVVAEADIEGSFEIDYGVNEITVWGWPTSSVKVFLNGNEISGCAGLRQLAVPAVPEGQTVSSLLKYVLGRKNR